MKRSSPITLLVLAFVIFATVACMCSIFNQREPLVFTPDQLPDAQVGVPYEATISISQNDTPVGGLSLSKGTLPPGMELVYKRAEDTAKITGALPPWQGRTPSPSMSGVSGQTHLGRMAKNNTR